MIAEVTVIDVTLVDVVTAVVDYYVVVVLVLV